jgi:uncharacterized protein (UPF0548 family)
MFFARRPSPDVIDRFLRESRDAALSYGAIGIVDTGSAKGTLDETSVAIGRGAADFATARSALMSWKQFDLGWVEVFPPAAPVVVGTNVAVLIRHLGFWSLNGCRVVSGVGGPDDPARYGYAYGALTNHAEGGEERFEVFLDPQTDHVIYRIRAISWPQATLARLGQPIVRRLQARFRTDSAAAMMRAVRADSANQGVAGSIPSHLR